MLRLIDSLFDRVAQRLAENMCSNMDLVEQNREARCQEEVSHRTYHQRGVSKYQSEAYKAIESELFSASFLDANSGSVTRRAGYEPSVFIA